MSQLVGFNRGKAGSIQILLGHGFSPHGSEALAILSQGYRHAMHTGDGIQKSAERVLFIFFQVASAVDVLHQVNAVPL